MATSVKYARKTKKVPTSNFKRFQSDRFKRISRTGHRKSKGIDSCHRRRFRGRPVEPKVGYGTNKLFKHKMKNGLKQFNVSNVQDVELLLLQTKTYAAEIAHNVSSRKRVEILEKAKALGVKVTNPQGRLRQEVAA